MLASLPPQWKVQDVRPPFGISSIFDSLGKRKSVKQLVKELRSFLESNPPQNIETRHKRQALLFEIIDEVRFYTDSILALPLGWSANMRCMLQDAQKLWLDPGRATTDKAFAQALLTANWQELISNSFGNWLNNQLNDKLIFSDVEYRFWSDIFYNVDWSREPVEHKTLVSTRAVKDV